MVLHQNGETLQAQLIMIVIWFNGEDCHAIRSFDPLPDHAAFIVKLGNRSAILHALLNRVVAALAK